MKRGYEARIAISVISQVFIGMVMVICIPIAFAP